MIPFLKRLLGLVPVDNCRDLDLHRYAGWSHEEQDCCVCLDCGKTKPFAERANLAR